METNSNSENLRNKLIDSLIESGIIKTKKIEAAFRKVPREIFLPNFKLNEVYTDGSVITKMIGVEPISSSTAPSLMASMIEILKVKPNQKILEIGTGTGYNAAILTEVAGNQNNIYSVDIDQVTVNEAINNLNSAEYKNININCNDGRLGYIGQKDFDRIIFTASVKKIPKKVVDQLKVGGILVLPLWINGTQFTPALVKQKNGQLISKKVVIGGFMDLRKKTMTQITNTVTKKDLSKNLIICSEHQKLFDYTKTFALLKSKPEKIDFKLEKATTPRAGNFYRFLAINEKKSVELFIEKPTKELSIGDSAAGIVDIDKNSACLILENNQIQKYGTDFALNKLKKLYTKWVNLGQPDVDRFKIKTNSDATNISLLII